MRVRDSFRCHALVGSRAEILLHSEQGSASIILAEPLRLSITARVAFPCTCTVTITGPVTITSSATLTAI